MNLLYLQDLQFGILLDPKVRNINFLAEQFL